MPECIPDGYTLPEGDAALIDECGVQTFRAGAADTGNAGVRLVHGPTAIRIESRRRQSADGNRELAAKWLREKIEDMQSGDPVRVAKHRPVCGDTSRVAGKRRDSEKKAARRNPRPEDH